MIFFSSNSNTFHPALKATSRLVAGKNYDILEYHADKFKNPEKDFEPRIKNTRSASHLIKKASFYQPPIPRLKKDSKLPKNYNEAHKIIESLDTNLNEKKSTYNLDNESDNVIQLTRSNNQNEMNILNSSFSKDNIIISK